MKKKIRKVIYFIKKIMYNIIKNKEDIWKHLQSLLGEIMVGF